MYTGCIYRLDFPSNKVYIGQTIDLPKRLKQHKALTRPKTKLARAIKKYTWDSMVVTILEEATTCTMEELKAILNELEIKYINDYDAYNNGYNCTLGGDGTVGRKHSQETIDRLRDLNKGKTLTELHKQHIKEGLQKADRVFTEETREKIRLSKLGDKNPNYGKKLPKETVDKMLESRKGFKHSEESKEKISKANKGKTKPPDAIASMALKHRKKVVQLDINHKLIKIWDSVKEAVNSTKIYSIGKICRKVCDQKPPYIWLFETEYLESLK